MSSPKEIAEMIIKKDLALDNVHSDYIILARAYLDAAKELETTKAALSELEKDYRKLDIYKSKIKMNESCLQESFDYHKEEITKLKKSREVLRKFVDHCCSWNEGEVVTGSFDSPWTAKEAREALKADDEIMDRILND